VNFGLCSHKTRLSKARRHSLPERSNTAPALCGTDAAKAACKHVCTLCKREAEIAHGCAISAPGRSSAAAAEGYHVAVLHCITLQRWSVCLSSIGACLYPTLDRGILPGDAGRGVCTYVIRGCVKREAEVHGAIYAVSFGLYRYRQGGTEAVSNRTPNRRFRIGSPPLTG